MANKIQFKRGVKANLPTLNIGEPAFTTDENDFYIGNGTSNIKLAKTNIQTTISSLPSTYEKVTKELYTISGSNTAGTPSSGYIYTPQIFPHVLQIDTDSGYNYSTDSNTGRTGICAYRTTLNHNGNGDIVCYNGSVYIGGTKSGSTHFLANPAGVFINGDMTAGADGIYFNPLEFYLNDNGYDVAGVGAVYNLVRTNDTGAKSSVWIGVRTQSLGTKYSDCGYSLCGKFKVGFDTTSATVNAAIAVKRQDRIYMDASSTADSKGINWYANNLGDTWIDTDSSGNFRFVIDNSPAFQIGPTWVATTNTIYAGAFGVNNKQIVGAQQSAIANADSTNYVTTINSILTAMRNHGLIAT